LSAKMMKNGNVTQLSNSVRKQKENQGKALAFF
jgi:hypothetical protein